MEMANTADEPLAELVPPQVTTTGPDLNMCNGCKAWPAISKGCLEQLADEKATPGPHRHISQRQYQHSLQQQRWFDRQTDRPTDGQTERRTDGDTNRDTDSKHTPTHTHTHTLTLTHTHTQARIHRFALLRIMFGLSVQQLWLLCDRCPNSKFELSKTVLLPQETSTSAHISPHLAALLCSPLCSLQSPPLLTLHFHHPPESRPKKRCRLE